MRSASKSPAYSETAPSPPRRLRKRKIALGLALFILAILIAAPYALNREDRSMNEAARRTLIAEGHHFQETSVGTTHYEVRGPQEGHVVVLLHGASGPMTIWDRTVEPLAEAGYRVVRFDFFGRGYSDRIDVDYKLDVFVEQLDALLTTFEVTRPVTLIASSLGGIVAAEMALQHPERVHSIAFIGPAGFKLEASPLAKLAQVRWLGDYIMKVLGDKKLLEHHRKYFVEPERFEAYHAAYSKMLRYRGTKAAILSTLRNAPLQSYTKSYARFGAANVPSLLLWGVDDATFPIKNHKTFLEAVPHAQFTSLEGTGHLPMLETPEPVNSAILQFLGALLAH